MTRGIYRKLLIDRAALLATKAQYTEAEFAEVIHREHKKALASLIERMRKDIPCCALCQEDEDV